MRRARASGGGEHHGQEAPAAALADRELQGQAVYEVLRTTAEASQAGILQILETQGVPHKAFWIANTIRVVGDRRLAEGLASRPEVDRIIADRSFALPEPQTVTPKAAEWNLQRIGADQVWNTLGITGEGIVVANLDTGVDITHEALVAHYRGTQPDGSFDNEYNFYDPTGYCGGVPCDNNSHGTHTMGTMVGGDGPGDFAVDIGVAPGAKFIAAKGCEEGWCSAGSLLAGAQWLLAPTDSAGNNPRPDLRPHVINNSWGGYGGDPWFQDMVRAWRAAGIFPVFSAGNSGAYFCGDTGSPGDYPESFAVGATDFNDNIAYFSSSGPGAFGQVKPDVSAPGQDVYSSVPGGYAYYSGTSMAAPHVAATVALLWAYAPALVRDLDATAAVLRGTAVDRIDFSCGGDADGDPNNIYGDGRIDALAALLSSPRIAGVLEGAVTDAVSGEPVPFVELRATRDLDSTVRTVQTDALGQFHLNLATAEAPASELYTVEAAGFGYLAFGVSDVAIVQDQTTHLDIPLAPLPRHQLSGTVTDERGATVAGAHVDLRGAGAAPTVTGADGTYLFTDVPEGDYTLIVEAGHCTDTVSSALALNADLTRDVSLSRRIDAFGNTCETIAPDWIPATHLLSLYYNYAGIAVDLPFDFPLYGRANRRAFVTTDGLLTFGGDFETPWNTPLPDPAFPNGSIMPLWGYGFVDPWYGGVFTETLGTAPQRTFVIEYRDIYHCGYACDFVTFQVQLHETTGAIDFVYQSLPDTAALSATVGIENFDGTDAFQYSYNEAGLTSGTAIRIVQPPSGFVSATVTDANDHLPLAGATVSLSRAGAIFAETKSDELGEASFFVPTGDYMLTVEAKNYVTAGAGTHVATETPVSLSFALATGRLTVSAADLNPIMPTGTTRTRTLTLSNTGTAPATYRISESAARYGAPMAPQAGVGDFIYGANTPFAAPTGNGAGSDSVLPKAYRWTANRPTSAARILLYADDPVHAAPGTYIDQALQALGMSYTAHYNGDYWGFEDDLLHNTWDLVIFADDWYIAPFTTDSALEAYLLGGGKLIYQSYFGPSARSLQDALGAITWNYDYDPPDEIRWWSAGNTLFTRPEIVPEPTARRSGVGYFGGVHLYAQAGAETLAGYGPTEQLGEAALVVANDDRSIYKGFIDANNDADLDADGAPDARELWVNLVNGIVNGFGTDVPWLSESSTTGTLAAGATANITVTIDMRNQAAGSYATHLRIRSDSGRQQSLGADVVVVASAYQIALNAGGAAFTDSKGDPFSADQKYTNTWGYLQKGTVATSRNAIAGTVEDTLYQSQREDPGAYNFAGAPAGMYQVDLLSAEFSITKPNKRLYDVYVENTLVLGAHDVYTEVGRFAADNHSFFVRCNDGILNVRFVPRAGQSKPIINALRVTQRPDM